MVSLLFDQIPSFHQPVHSSHSGSDPRETWSGTEYTASVPKTIHRGFSASLINHRPNDVAGPMAWQLNRGQDFDLSVIVSSIGEIKCDITREFKKLCITKASSRYESIELSR